MKSIAAALTATALIAVAGGFAAEAAETDPTHPAVTTAPGGFTKVLMIPEENKSYDQVIGSSHAPYLNHLAKTYGSATDLNAGYPVKCRSLPAYLIMTSGSDQGLCKNRLPGNHPLITGQSVFGEVAADGKQWRSYNESMPAACATTNDPTDHFDVWHTPVPNYADTLPDCAQWDVPMGASINSGPFHTDLTTGQLPALSMLVPNDCHDMHGSTGCTTNKVRTGDDWLRTVIPQILASSDYTEGRLVVVITWDEGTSTDNHIPTVVISASTHHVKAGQAADLCSVLGLVSHVARVSPLGCAATAQSLVAAFGL